MKRRMAWMAIVAVTLVVMLIVTILNIMNTILNDTKSNNHRWSGDIVISRDSLVGFPYYENFLTKLNELNAITATTPVIKTYAIIELNSLQVYGIQMENFSNVTDFHKTLFHQKNSENPTLILPENQTLRPDQHPLTAEQKKRGCILGCYWITTDLEQLQLAHETRLRPERQVPIDITIFPINSKGSLTGSALGETQRFWYMDACQTGLVDIDQATAYVDFDELQKLTFMDGQDGSPARISEIRIKCKPGYDLTETHTKIQKLWDNYIATFKNQTDYHLLSDVKVQTWELYRRSFIVPVEKEKNVMTVTFSILSVVSAFIILAIFYTIVTEKIKDLGMIKSIGGSNWGVQQIFIGYGFSIGLVGTFFGVLFGCLLVINSNHILDFFGIQIWNPKIYAIDKVPNTIDINQTIAIALVAILFSTCAAIIPAMKAGKLKIVEALRID